MLEKRKHKRLKMEHALELARLNADGTADGGVVNADILNISRGGVGFLSRKRLEGRLQYKTACRLYIADGADDRANARESESAKRFRTRTAGTFSGSRIRCM